LLLWSWLASFFLWWSLIFMLIDRSLLYRLVSGAFLLTAFILFFGRLALAVKDRQSDRRISLVRQHPWKAVAAIVAIGSLLLLPLLLITLADSKRGQYFMLFVGSLVAVAIGLVLLARQGRFREVVGSFGKIDSAFEALRANFVVSVGGLLYVTALFPEDPNWPVLGITALALTITYSFTLRVLWSTQARREVPGPLTGLNRYVVLAFPCVAFCQALAIVTAVTYAAVEIHAVSFVATEAITTSRVSMFYVWAFADSVPIVQIPETLRWAIPLDYKDSRIGALVLIFQVGAILPVIAAIRSYWGRIHEETPSERQDSGE